MKVYEYYRFFFRRQIQKLSYRKIGKAYLGDIVSIARDYILYKHIDVFAGAMAYSFFLALFPTLIFLLALLPYIPIDNFQNLAINWIKEFLPGDAFSLVYRTVKELFEKRTFGFFSLNFLAIVFFATRGVNTMVQAINEIDQSDEPLSFFKKQINSLIIFATIFFLGFLGVIAFITGEVVLKILFTTFRILRAVEYYLLSLLNWGVEFFIILLAVSIIYNWAPKAKKTFRLFSVGAVIAAFLMLFAQFGLKQYFLNFSSYNKLYGSLGAVITLMVWFYFMSLALLVGFVLNQSIKQATFKNKAQNIT
ncbi:MAG: YihY/virulence factor BrkB family protein [Bacteroidia bacterium]|nr:YihY/virulence factor BrkB family protein [Bacteroidia bacterium]MDW8158744.1 YihY/virulence factor BrkB family protein [Bacteroidia bacterium]